MAAPDSPTGLTSREREMLAFERSWWTYDGARDAAIRARFDLSPTEYHQALGELIDRPEALAHDALLVRRLRRRRAARTRDRSLERAARRPSEA